MAVPWYEWRPIRERLLTYGRALQGVRPYRTVLEPDRARCPSGFTSFTKRLVMVNPTLFARAPREQYALTKAVLCHEAGHRRFTTPAHLPPHVALVSNILEDERTERLMEAEFVGVRTPLKQLNAAMLTEAQPLDPASDDPVEVLNHILQLRWSERCGQPLKGALSPRNQERWRKVEPLVRESGAAEATEVCDRNAAEILKLLGIREAEIPEWLRDLIERMETVEGERGEGDPAERAAPGPDATTRDGEDDLDEPFDGEPPPKSDGAGPMEHHIEPQPYLELVEKVRPLVRRLVEALAPERPTPSPEPSERGTRFSVRRWLQDPERPFLAQEDTPPGPPTLTFRVVIDHSTSMNHQGRIKHAAEAAMLLHLAGVDLAIPHQVIVTPDDLRIADLGSGEGGLALIAGIVPAQTGYEDTGLAVARHGGELAAMPEPVKLLLVLHDGMGNDHELLGESCRLLRDRVLILGVGIGMGEAEAALLREQFGADRYVHCREPADLPNKMGAVLRAIRGA